MHGCIPVFVCHLPAVLLLVTPPFFWRRGSYRSATRISPSFFAQALNSSSAHTQELVVTLSNALQSGLESPTSFYGYCLLVAGTVHSLFRYSADTELRHKSIQCLNFTMELLARKAKVWGNSACMVSINTPPPAPPLSSLPWHANLCRRQEAAMKQFAAESESYGSLIDPLYQVTAVSQPDIERLFSLLDHGTMSEITKFGAPDEDLDIPDSAKVAHYPNYEFPSTTNVRHHVPLRRWK